MLIVIQVINLFFKSEIGFLFVSFSVFDTMTALNPAWRESSILSFSTINESPSPLSDSLLPPEEGELVEEPPSPEYVQFIQVDIFMECQK